MRLRLVARRDRSWLWQPVLDLQRAPGYGLYVGSLFVGCVVYANDIVLLSASCYGLQKLVNVCESYEHLWDIKFNPLKSQTVSFGGQNPSQCQIMLTYNPIPWVNKVKYLGVYFYSNTGTTDISDTCRKLYGWLNSILSVLGSCSNEMAAVHPIKIYCLPTLMYGCEIWSLTDSSVHTISGAWNNCFRRIFNCCWRDSTKVLQYYCNVLPIPYLTDQRRLIFGARFATQKIWCCKHCHLQVGALWFHFFVLYKYSYLLT